MDATPVAAAQVQLAPAAVIEQLFARFRLAQQLWFVSSTLMELDACPAVDAALLQHYRGERTRLERALGIEARPA